MWHAANIADTAGFTFVVKQKGASGFQDYNLARLICLAEAKKKNMWIARYLEIFQ